MFTTLDRLERDILRETIQRRRENLNTARKALEKQIDELYQEVRRLEQQIDDTFEREDKL